MRWSAGFAGVCAIGIPLWWAALVGSAAARAQFVPDGAWPQFQPVVVPDLMLMAITAHFALRLFRGAASTALAGATFGAWAYATALTVAWAMWFRAPLAGPVLMIGALAGFARILYGMVSSGPSRGA